MEAAEMFSSLFDVYKWWPQSGRKTQWLKKSHVDEPFPFSCCRSKLNGRKQTMPCRRREGQSVEGDGRQFFWLPLLRRKAINAAMRRRMGQEARTSLSWGSLSPLYSPGRHETSACKLVRFGKLVVRFGIFGICLSFRHPTRSFWEKNLQGQCT